jgi:hypothetical protein
MAGVQLPHRPPNVSFEGEEFMKKWVGPLISLFLIAAFLMFFSPFFSILKSAERGKEGTESRQILLAQKAEREEGRGESDPHLIQILKKLREMIDEWLKSLDERIESEDITRFEVRFLEILRNMLAWIKEKIDAKIASSEQNKPGKKERGMFRETHQNISPIFRLC